MNEVIESGGLLGGLTAWHFRLLCENPWNGGGGYDPREVAQWSPDQCWFRLCDKDLLGRKREMEPLAVATDKDGLVRGKAADGTTIKGRIRGKSVARQLMEEEEKRKAEEKEVKQAADLKRKRWEKRKRKRVGK